MATPRPSSEAESQDAAGGSDASSAPAAVVGNDRGAAQAAAGSSGAGPCDAHAALAALRERGAQRADPVRFRFIEALARRAEGQPEPVSRLLDARLAHALDDYIARHVEALPDDAPPSASASASASAHAPSPLGELVQSLARAPAAAAAPGPHHAKSATPELQALDFFRHTWARLAVHRSMNQSLAKTPKNAGPLNSHRLVLRSLEVMREVSPAYLNRFVTYVDALLVLDGMGTTPPEPPPAPTPPAEGEKKRKAARGAGASRRG
jgi:hypothetical protein